ncbi:hypothetical protein [Paraburkholderia graminis]|uniref:hypothetical protein n=1 Tax=Paraburkholderia graminis TaxID=60548 RepID=UPI0038B97AC7
MANTASRLPRWDDPKLKAGTMVRTALWLISEIGVGYTFTKEQHRKAFAGIAQADRRLRDLRSYGWVIHTSSEDVSLNANEQRLVKVGAHVWDPAGRATANHNKISAKERMEIFARGNYQCSVCGIAGGETYPDDPYLTAVLSISKREEAVNRQNTGGDYVVECKLCKAGKRERDEGVQIIQRIEQLNGSEQQALALFLAEEPENRVLISWLSLCRLSVSAKAEVKRILLEKLRLQEKTLF